MQRGTYAIALSDHAVEGGLVVRGELQPAFSQSVLAPSAPPAGEQPPQPLLRAYLEQAQWEEGWAVLVLPSEHVSYRRLHFEFSDPKKIRQVLPFELENELLDGLDRYVYDAEIEPVAEGGADVRVFLAGREALHEIAETVERYKLSLQCATFSAQALIQAMAPARGRHVCLYVGSEESFLVLAVDGKLQTLHPITPHPGELLPALRELGPGSPYDQLQALFQSAAEDARHTSLRDKLRAALEEVQTEAGRFLRVQGTGEPCTVSLHGLFGELFEWRPDAGGLNLDFPTGTWPGARRTHFGVLDELLRRPRPLTAARALNFHRRTGAWVPLLRELRWPLAVAGVLLLLLGGLLGSTYYLRVASLRIRLDVAGQELQRMLKVPPPVNSFTVNAALSRVQERLDRLRREQAAGAYLDRYHYDTLKLLTKLSQAVKEQQGVTVDALTYNQERFTLTGVTPSYEEGERLRTRIGELEQFKGRTVKVTHANAGKQIRYRLTVER